MKAMGKESKADLRKEVILQAAGQRSPIFPRQRQIGEDLLFLYRMHPVRQMLQFLKIKTAST
jgi:hypothetical protein